MGNIKGRGSPLRHHPEAVEIDLIRGLFHAFAPALVMTISFLSAGLVILNRTGDSILLVLLILGAVASVARLVSAHLIAPVIHAEGVTIEQARYLERLFAIPYLCFSLVLGLFGFRLLQLPSADTHMVAAALSLSYCAGVAVGMGSRMWIAVPSMILALGPVIAAMLLQPDFLYKLSGAVMAAILLSGIQSLRGKQNRSADDIALRIAFSHLARKDALTALPNRIALREWWEQVVASGAENKLVAVHYLDLNDFKPVNDRHGHPVGDALLAAAGKRIARTIRDSDIVARLGGDEFAVIQYDIVNADDAAQLAARIREAITQPFSIGALTLKISTGHGFVVSRGRDEALEDLLALADKALYTSKQGGEISQYEAVETITRRVA
ncbi:diguanylate cyclase (GGDEF)-like protein [Sphingobium sp. B2D3A]|uniref:GGDEF domain-containing protein n=2 Tax=Sphingomonadaceae TaxID=41297 RepID=UPI0016187467|nr:MULTISPECIES: GGDEF domain-containing protein [Sphingobium]MCW2337333.1 diguanylate cyclase (GGDEF)-like protein [Sphingobium sp. B2D3A]MCW2383791.1 diguanylate cyclase (GGDEF)-like protein [Sphingobium sp. B2D3D]MCW2400845.1 diguanylate cyclase (GGDEF)-like protein [Sphingobium sp. B10D7B]